MHTVQAIQLYLLGGHLASVRRIREGDSVAEWQTECRQAVESLSSLIANRDFDFSLSVRHAGERLTNALTTLLAEKRLHGPGGEFGHKEIVTLTIEILFFEPLLADELNHRVSLFRVSKKGIFDTLDLIDSADRMFTDEKLRARLPEQARLDFLQGGRCLAFETPTAAGFHVLRAVEAVMKKYYNVLAKADWPFTQRDWGRYIAELGKMGAVPRVIALLTQIKDNYRNPLMHPEDNLDIHEAVGLFAITQGAINAILQEISKLDPVQESAD